MTRKVHGKGVIIISRKLKEDEVNKILSDYQLIKIDNEIYKNNTIPILCINKDGYKVLSTINRLKSYKTPRPFDKNNPYTIENIKLFLLKTNSNIELLSNEYFGSEIKLSCKCKIDNYIWQVSWENLRQGKGCPKCKSRIIPSNCNTLNEIKYKLMMLNKDLVILDNNYINCHKKLNLQCKNGHIFKRSWNKLITQGTNCPECSKLNYQGSYNITNAEKNKNEWMNKKASIYIVKLYNSNEEFYKIGITVRNIENRMKDNIPYNFKILYKIKTNMYNAIYIENELHYHHKKFQYIPFLLFDGWTECFNNIDGNFIKNTQIALQGRSEN